MELKGWHLAVAGVLVLLVGGILLLFLGAGADPTVPGDGWRYSMKLVGVALTQFAIIPLILAIPLLFESKRRVGAVLNVFFSILFLLIFSVWFFLDLRSFIYAVDPVKGPIIYDYIVTSIVMVVLLVLSILLMLLSGVVSLWKKK